MSREELEGWVQRRGLDNGYVIVKRRSKKKGDKDVKVWLNCTRSGEHKSVAVLRKTGTKKIGCPFLLAGAYDSTRKVWRLEVLNEMHNHGPTENLEGYAYARRLSTEEYKLVEDMAAQDIPIRSIWKTITKHNPKNKCVQKDIHNIIQKINLEKNKGRSPMQLLENLLSTQNFTYYTRENPSTNAVEEIFFVTIYRIKCGWHSRMC